MDKNQAFTYLKKQKKAVLLDYLRAAFDEMTAPQREAVFADAVPKPTKAPVDADQLRYEIDQFRRDSLARRYYAPFMMNSKNYRDIPEKTRQWCGLFARFVADASELTARGDHAQAVSCFALLEEVFEAFESGKEIIFAEEAGSWLIPTDHKAWRKSYLTSLAAATTPEAFTAVAIPMLQRDSRCSFADRVYAAAREAANPQQKACLEAEIRRRAIPTRPMH